MGVSGIEDIGAAAPAILGGGALFYLSDIVMPEKFSGIGKIAGVGVALYGLAKLVSGSPAGPKLEEAGRLPIETPTADLQGKILVPAKGGRADLSGKIALATGFGREYPVSIQLTNRGGEQRTFSVALEVEEIPPWPQEKQRKVWINEGVPVTVAAGETVVLHGKMPVATSILLGTVYAVATLKVGGMVLDVSQYRIS